MSQTGVKATTNSECILPLPETEMRRARGIILLVEDEGFVRESAGQVLQSAGYRVLKTPNAAEALRVFLRHPWDVQLLITDVVMPGGNGRDLARDLTTISPRLITIFVSGYPKTVVTQDGLPDSGASYLAKPFSAEELLHQVAQVLEGKDKTTSPKA